MERAEASLSQQQQTPPRTPGLGEQSKTPVETTTTTTAPKTATGMEHVDSIVLVYDLDRVETFFRLERHWLPLIQRCYNGKVRSRSRNLLDACI